MSFYRSFATTLLFIFSYIFCGNLISGPLHDAVNRKDYQEVIDIFTKETTECWSEIVNSVDENGQTPLHLAAFWGASNIMWFLLLIGANVNAVINLKEGRYHGFTPLHCVIWSSVAEYAGREDLIKCAKLLLDKGADVNIKDLMGGKTPCQVVEYLHSGLYNDEVVAAINNHLGITVLELHQELKGRQKLTKRKGCTICDIMGRFGNFFSFKRSKEKRE